MVSVHHIHSSKRYFQKCLVGHRRYVFSKMWPNSMITMLDVMVSTATFKYRYMQPAAVRYVVDKTTRNVISWVSYLSRYSTSILIIEAMSYSWLYVCMSTTLAVTVSPVEQRQILGSGRFGAVCTLTQPV
jgi:hypothetical protein